MQNAVIIGNYGATNLGDEAILDNILKSHPEINFTVFSHNPEETQKTHNTEATYPLPFGLRSILRGNTANSLKALKQCDFVIIGGGGLFTDEKLKAVLLWAWHFFWAKHYQKPVFFYANSIGPLKSRIGKWISKKVFQKADFITVRDSKSAEYLKDWNIKNYEITSDPAFFTNSPTYQGGFGGGKKIAISLRNWIKNEKNYLNALKETVRKLEKDGFHVLLISMQSFQDDDFRILSQISSEKSLIITPKTYKELLKILSDCEFTIGMRLHFLIASALANIPFITLSYSQKTDSLCKKLGMEKYLLPISKIEPNELETLINEIIKNKKKIKVQLMESVELEKKDAKKNVEVLRKWVVRKF